jgi:hypothetical protein
MKTSIMVSVAAISALAAAVVLASPMITNADSTPAQVPNRADAFFAATCGDVTPTAVSAHESWHNALASKRASERDIVLASGSSDLAKGCASTD